MDGYPFTYPRVPPIVYILLGFGMIFMIIWLVMQIPHQAMTSSSAVASDHPITLAPPNNPTDTLPDQEWVIPLSDGWTINGGPDGEGGCNWDLTQDGNFFKVIAHIAKCTYEQLKTSFNLYKDLTVEDGASNALYEAIQKIFGGPPPAMP